MSKPLSIREYEPTLTSSWQTIVNRGEDPFSNGFMFRNELTERVELRFDEDNNQILSIEAGEKLILDSINKVRGNLVEARAVPSVPGTFRMNAFL